MKIDRFAIADTAVEDVAAVDGDARGLAGGFTDGRYAWLPPYAGTKAARIDLANLTASGVRAVDLGEFDGTATKFESGLCNGQFGFMVPFRSNLGIGSKLMRVQLFQGPGSL